ncbi:MAG: hypothetical protein WD069_17465 [Planctomycetales bacterium]
MTLIIIERFVIQSKFAKARHAREGGHPAAVTTGWIPACAGMTESLAWND